MIKIKSMLAAALLFSASALSHPGNENCISKAELAKIHEKVKASLSLSKKADAANQRLNRLFFQSSTNLFNAHTSSILELQTAESTMSNALKNKPLKPAGAGAEPP